MECVEHSFADDKGKIKNEIIIPDFHKTAQVWAMQDNDGTIVSVGFLSFKGPGWPTPILHDLATRHHFRGRGFASAIIQNMKFALKNLGYKYLKTQAQNKTLLTFYSSLRFKSFGVRELWLSIVVN